MLTRILMIALSVLAGMTVSVQAEKVDLKHFTSGSYQQLLGNHADKPVMLAIWSITCASCMEKMPLLHALQKSRPDVNIVMLAVDDLADQAHVRAVLAEHGLADAENWIFADENVQRLRHEIDPAWFGELPRTYFLNGDHERHGVSGTLSYDDYQSIFKVLLN
ncbi:MAG TPA: TlpA disulfide reductase family protein [Nitrosomonas nitrosa]|nr:TlpA disulfide reductase family protein [Nitrosomonas nitrosa]